MGDCLQKAGSRVWIPTMLFLLFGLIPHRAICQVYHYTETSSRFLSDADYDSLIFKKALGYATNQKLSSQDLKERMFPYRSRFAEALYPHLFHNFKLIDRDHEHIRKGSSSYAPARKKYLALVKTAVDRAFEYPSSFYPIFSIEITDRILSFHSEVHIETSGLIRVIETITVYNGDGRNSKPDRDTLPSRNDDIQRGIVRDFPTKYKDSSGLWHTTGFKILQVYKNGVKEPFISRSLENGKRIFIGEEDKILDPGIYTYRIEYTTSRQLIFHRDKDEFYWNVNGNGWVFSADSVSCVIHFPEGSRLLEWDCYTGIQGSAAKDCRVMKTGEHSIKFWSVKKLESYEGLTVAVAIHKGILVAPGKVSSWGRMALDNIIVPVLLLLDIVLFLFYYRAWKKKGKDPEEGTIYPRFEPPAGLKPADTGYILHQRFGTHLFAAALVDAAVHHHLDIGVERKGSIFKHTSYSFNKPEVNGKQSSILHVSGVPYSSANENDFMTMYGFQLNSIYGQTAEKGKYNPRLKEFQSALEKSLRSKFRGGQKSLFRLNSGYVVIGSIISFGALVGSFIYILNNYSFPLLVVSAILLVALFTIHIVFANIMSAYTPEGQQIADNIRGFRMYLKTAEQHYFDRLTPPHKTLELFEKYLPYAIALKVENEWAENFHDQIQQAIDRGYQPAYYNTHGSFGSNFGLADLSNGLSSGLSGTISSASTPPSKSGGGSGGGGRSGGGGGGGGGGGW